MDPDLPRDDEPPSLARTINSEDVRAAPFPLAYYVDVNCPDRHITAAIQELLREHLEETPAEDKAGLPPGERCRALAEKAKRIRWLMAVNPHTPAPVLEGLVDAGDPAHLERIAENPGASPVTLARLAFHPSEAVRAAVAENSRTPIEAVCMLANDECVDVRFRLAESYHLPLAILQVLCDDDNPFVAARARKTLRRICTADEVDDVRQFPSLSPFPLMYGTGE